MVEVVASYDQALKSDHSTRPSQSPPLGPPQPNEGSTAMPPHRSHDPENNLKRSDPFKFGSRYLQEDDNVFEFNAWDHVIPDENYYTYAEAQYASQRAAPVSEFDKSRFNAQPEKWWNKFYSNNTSNFFKDRKWLHQEFPILSNLTIADAGAVALLEVGAGAGNTAFPILRANENASLMLYACDFSSKAVELMKANEAYNTEHIRASVWDISGEELPEGVPESSVDVVLLVFIFSALSPKQWDAAVRNVWRVLKPGGEVCFRDYGKGDLTQVRFKKGRLLEENFYIRGDGTRVYFFEENELRKIWGGKNEEENGFKHEPEGPIVNGITKMQETAAEEDLNLSSQQPHALKKTQVDIKDATTAGVGSNSFEIVSLGADRRMLVNRQKQLKMYRCWMQGRFKKPIPT